MSEIGYSADEIGIILSQVCLAAIGGNVVSRMNTSSLAISFGDVNDYDFEQNRNIIRKVNDMRQGFINYDSSIGYAVAGDREHSFKKYMAEDSVLSSKISCFLNVSIDNALRNRNNDIIEPITYEKIQNAFADLDNSNNKTL